MVAFTAGIKRPQQNTNLSNPNQAQNTYDRLVTVTGYDVAKSYMYVKDHNDKQYEVFVNPEEVKKNDAAIKAKGTDRNGINWMGHSIDAGMEKHVPVGSKVVLIRSKVNSNDKTRNMAVTEVHRIVGVPNPDPDKTFTGVFTMTYRRDETKERIARVQHWMTKAISVNDGAGLEELRNKIDEARKNYGTKLSEYTITEPTIGVQYRALVKTDRMYIIPPLDGRPIYEVVDCSVPFDWIPGREDENGKEIKSEAHVLNGAEMLSFAEAYTEHIMNHEQFKDNLNNMRVEVCYYYVYPASANDALLLTHGNPEKDRYADKNPLYQLSHRKSYVDMANGDDALIVGRNAAVNGIIQIASNKPVKVGSKWEELRNYWVNKVHANNTRGHVHSFIRSVDETGQEFKAEPHEALKLVKTEQQQLAEQNAANKTVNQTSVVPTAAPRANPVPVSNNEVDNAGTFDPFAEVAITPTVKTNLFAPPVKTNMFAPKD